jgi:Lrp/AsnC family transcriptional regulator, regulator for asnA, asnC and gidA
MIKNDITGFHLDSLDKRILSLLTKDARMPFVEVARKCRVSGAAIHQRVAHMTEAGVISGSAFRLSPQGLGYMTCAFIGIQVNLTSTSTHNEVFNKIKEIPEIVECHHISGKYSLLIKVYTRNNEHLKKIIVERIQSIPEITFTETFISLEAGFVREMPVE